MTADDEDSSEGEEVHCSLVPHHNTNFQITEINNAVPCGGDTNRSDFESDNVSKNVREDKLPEWRSSHMRF